MSLSFAGISLLSPWVPLYSWDDPLHLRSGVRSFLWALVFVTIILILAYLTNPTEISFRAYLTEQSFRHHLNHLDDLTDDSGTEVEYGLPHARPRGSAGNIGFDRTTLPFHFANRASVSLRTPKHILHSFGICTIATTRGSAAIGGRRSGTTLNGAEHGAAVASDTWYIGAFGHWWRGGWVDSWCYDAIVRSKDSEGWSSGILGFKASDKFSEHNGLSLTKPGLCPRLLQRGVAPKLRNRERSALILPRRNTTPPPLPKSVTLPLHADHRIHESFPVASHNSHLGSEHKRIHTLPATHTISRTCSASNTWDHSPIIADVLKQIATAKASVHELQTQLSEAQASATQSHTQLEAELDELRAKKREEDQKRADGRARTKSLEEARRVAETRKREAEKKLKVTRGTKESATRHVEELEREIGRLKQCIDRDRAALATQLGDTDAKEEHRLMSELDTKRKEVRMAEEVITTLNARARELEDKIIESKERLRTAEELAARHFQDNNYCQTDSPGWPSSYMPFNHSANKFTTMELENGRIGPESGNSHRSPAVLSLGSLPAFRATAAESREPHSMLFDDAAPSHHTSQSLSASAFAPFDVQTPSSAYIPSSLISVLDSPSEEWSGGYIGESGTLSSSPVSFNGQAPESAVDLDLYEVGHRGQLSLGRSIYDQMGQPYRTNSDPTIPSDNPQVDTVSSTAESAPRRWFSISGREKPRKGLNPDAKVFRLPKRKLQTSGAATDTDMVNYSTLTSYDALNPTSLMTSIAPSTPSSLLRAFAPSRAEREALQRALSGSTNTSLELLPSLSDVGSIPPSPMHEHAQTEPQTTEKERLLPAWLQSLPLIRKPNFSPWEDEDTAPAEAKGV